jgi:DNA ligase (NAD+)
MSVVDEFSAAIADELREKISKARNDYYNGNAVVSDEQYDQWVDELAQLAPMDPLVVAIGAPVPESTAWKKVSHHIPMGSLDKAQNLDEFTNWVNDRGVHLPKYDEWFVTEKLDGISIHLRYEKGIFKQALSRGDGLVGEDITRNVAKMKGLPKRLDGNGRNFTGSIRGEVILLKSDFDTHFKEAGYRNTRNAAAGIAKRLDGTACEHLTLFVYQVVDGKDFITEAEAFEWLTFFGFNVPNWYVTAMAPGIRTPHDIWVDYQQSRRLSLDYDIDGLVVRVNNIARQLSLGEKDARPKGAVAFKFTPIMGETSVVGVERQTGATGRITPVAVLKPVNLLGTTVTHASLYNWRYIREIGFDVGALVKVTRSNDVIPRVVSVVKGTGTTYPTPKECTSCGAAPVEEGEYWVCSNIAGCPAQTSGRLRRYVQAIGVLEVGETLIDKLVAAGLVKTVADLYRLTEDQIAGIERMGAKSAKNVVKALWSVNPIPLETLLGAMSIPGCAESTMTMVMDAGINSLSAMRAADKSAFENIPGLGPVKAMALWTWFKTSSAVLDDLLSTGLKIKERVKGGLTGKSFCFTGSMPSGRKRAELESFVKDKGGTVKSSVTKGLTYLVIADPVSSSSKAQAAKKNGTTCISEEEFDQMLGAL